MLWIWAYECTLTLLCLCRSGADSRKIGVGKSLNDVVTSWLMLRTHLESIQHPCHMYTKCFSTLIWFGWAYGCALTLLCMCKLGKDSRKQIRVGQSLSDVVMSWLRLQTHLEHIPHSCHMYPECFSILLCCGWIWVHPYSKALVSGGVGFYINQGIIEPEWCCKIMVEAPNLLGVHPTFMIYLYKVF